MAWTDRARSHRQPSFDDSCLVETNDVALAHAWLDVEAQTALLASRYVSAPSRRVTAVMLRDGAWTHRLRRGAAIATRASSSRRPIGSRIYSASCSRSRIGRRAGRAPSRSSPATLGGTASPRVEVGGMPVLRVRRGAVDVTVRVLRRLDPDEPGRLRTVIGAHRLRSTGETLQLISEQLPRAAWPPPCLPPGERSMGAPRLPIEPGARRLLEAAKPAASIVRPHDVEITFHGAIVGGERLGAAIELAARWAADTAADGPYR